MKKIFSIFVILLGLNITVFAKDVSTINGSAYLSSGEYDSLIVNGNLNFQNFFIKNALITNGAMQGKNLKCHTLKSNGSVDIERLQAQIVKSNGSFFGENINITGKSEFNGKVDIKNGKIHDIQIASKKSTITNTQVHGNILIKKVNKKWNFLGFQSQKSLNQVLELRGNTTISGDVVFEEDGEVHLFDGAKIEGKTVKAQVVKK